jgi:hypothetical protein
MADSGALQAIYVVVILSNVPASVVRTALILWIWFPSQYDKARNCQDHCVYGQ